MQWVRRGRPSTDEITKEVTREEFEIFMADYPQVQVRKRNDLGLERAKNSKWSKISGSAVDSTSRMKIEAKNVPMPPRGEVSKKVFGNEFVGADETIVPDCVAPIIIDNDEYVLPVKKETFSESHLQNATLGEKALMADEPVTIISYAGRRCSDKKQPV